MIRYIFILAFLIPAALSAQVKATGVWYFDGAPFPQPRLPKGVEIGYDLESKKLYRWNRGADEWTPFVTEVSFDTTGLRNNVYELTTISDTSTILNPVEGDFFVKDSTTFGVYSTRWNVLYGGGGGGGGGPVSWNDIINIPSNVVNAISSVTSDATLSGLGTIATPLSVDTTLIASKEYLANELDDRIEVYKTIVASGNTTSLSIDFLPDTRYPILLFVNGILWSQDAAADFTLTGSTLNLNTTLFAGWRTTVQYTKLQ